jgi:hypothetical protein
MEIAEILRRFDLGPERFEREAVDAAVAQREEITPGLLHILEELLEDTEAFDPEGDRMAHLYACYLLAQFREPRAYPLLVRIAQLPTDVLDLLFEDFIAGDFGSVLASACDGDLTGIQSIIENEAADEWARGAAIRALAMLVGAGLKSREEVLAVFATLYRGKLVRDAKNETIWSELVASTSDLYAEELIEEIRQVFAEGLADPGYVGLTEVERDLAKGKERVLAELAANPHSQLITDTVKSFAGWACFTENGGNSPDDSGGDDFDGDPYAEDFDAPYLYDFEGGPVWASPSLPIRREWPKIGRNDPCPCGSGKKYKKCCLP